jgi:hypothetical protein
MAGAQAEWAPVAGRVHVLMQDPGTVPQLPVLLQADAQGSTLGARLHPRRHQSHPLRDLSAHPAVPRLITASRGGLTWLV